MQKILVILFITISSLANCQQNKTASSSNYRLVAHRGGIVEGIFDEFDPRSIQAAIDSGYWMLEIDVRPTADKSIILHHDGNLSRIYGINKKPEEMTLNELKQLRALKGGYSPMSLEELAVMCKGKIHFMVDVKPEQAESWFYAEIKRILEKYNMLDDAFFIRNDVEAYFNKGKFGFRMTEIPDIKKRMESGENIAVKYYLFDHGNRINAEAARWCQKNSIEVCTSVNIGHYINENHETGARRDIDYLQQAGVTIFQIDSDYDQYFNLNIH